MSELPKGWREVTLGDLVPNDGPIVYGIIQPGPEVPGGVPYIRPTELVDGGIAVDALKRTSKVIASKYRRSALRAGDIVLSIVGTIGKLAIVPPELEGANITQSSARVRPPESVLPAFLAACLRSDLVRRQIDDMEFGLGVRRLNIAHVRAIRVGIPPLEVQHEIVAKLDALQARSRRARAALDAIPPLLDKLRQSILAAAFRGDLTKEWRAQHPNQEPAHLLLQRIRTERRAKWEQAELQKLLAKGKPPKDDAWKAKYQEPKSVDPAGLPELPEGWCWATIDSVGDVLLGRRRADREYIAGEAGRVLRPYIRVANVKRDRLDLFDILTMPFSPSELELYRLRRGDIILSEGQSPDRVGESAVFQDGPEDLCIQATVHRFRANEQLTSSAFAQLAFLHHLSTGVFQAASSLTTNIAHLTSERLRPLPFPVPPLQEQAAIVTRVRPMLDKVAAQATAVLARTSLLANLDRGVLARAFRGD